MGLVKGPALWYAHIHRILLDGHNTKLKESMLCPNIYISPTYTQCLKTQKEDKKNVDGWNVDFLHYYDIFEWSKV